MNRAPLRFDELRRPGRDQHHEDHRRQDRRPGLHGGVAEDVLQVLLTDEHRAHQRPEHDQPGARGDPERAARRDVQVVQRYGRATLADDERDQRRDGDGAEADGESALVRHRGEVDGENEAGDRHHREDAAEVVDRIGRLVDVGGNERQRHHQGDDGQRQRDEEHRSPPEVLQEGAGDRAGRATEMPPPNADQSAMDFVRAGPDHNAVISASVVG